MSTIVEISMMFYDELLSNLFIAAKLKSYVTKKQSIKVVG